MKKIKIMAFPYNDASELEDALNECYERDLLIPLQELKLEENAIIGLSFHRYVSTFLMARSTEAAAETGRGGAVQIYMEALPENVLYMTLEKAGLSDIKQMEIARVIAQHLAIEFDETFTIASDNEFVCWVDPDGVITSRE